MIGANAGKGTEELVASVLNDYNDQYKNFAFHRYPDTRSASRGSSVRAMAAQPSDWLVSYQKQGVASDYRQQWHLEAKETIKTDSITLKAIRQYPMLKKFWWAGIEPVVLVNAIKLGAWLILPPHRLFPGCSPFEFDNNPTPKSFSFEGLFRYPDERAALKDVFRLNLKEKA